MLDSGIFTSTSASVVNGIAVGNKAKSTAFMAKLFQKLSGVSGISIQPSSSFYVQPKTGLTFTVKAGWGIMLGFPFDLPEDLDITLNSSTSEQTLYVSVRLDLPNNHYVDDDVVALTTFVAATDRAFARIIIPANAVTLTTAMISDLRYDSAYCGTIDEYRVSLAEIYAQYREGLAVVNAGGIPAHGTNHYADGSDPVTKRFSIAVSATWSGSSAPYTQEINVTGMTADMVPKLDITFNNSDAIADKLAQRTAFSLVDDIESGAGKITLSCFSSKPSTAFNALVEVAL